MTILHIDIENCFGKEGKQSWSKIKVLYLSGERISLINIQDYIDWEANLKLFREKGQAR